jgi:MurNAc alpha-1-phosphate uridylyltransferase
MSALDTAMVLAAGLGTRMRPLTNDRPKPLIEVAGRTLLDRSLDRVEEIGVSRAVVNQHYLPDMMRAHLAQRKTPHILYSDETDELLETGGGIVRALPSLGPKPFIVINSDNIWLGEQALSPLLDHWQPEKMDVLLLLVPVEMAVGYTRSGDFSLDDEARLVRRGDAPSAPLVFSGAQIIKPDVFKDAPQGPFSLNLIWDEIIAAKRAYGVIHKGQWCDVGTPDGLQLAEAAVNKG